MATHGVAVALDMSGDKRALKPLKMFFSGTTTVITAAETPPSAVEINLDLLYRRGHGDVKN